MSMQSSLPLYYYLLITVLVSIQTAVSPPLPALHSYGPRARCVTSGCSLAAPSSASSSVKWDQGRL